MTSRGAEAQHLRDLARLRRVRDRIDREYAQPLDVEALARDAHISAGHLSREFRQAYGESPYSYLMTRRIERAMALLRRGDLSITEVCFAVGCSSLGTFSTRFTELVGMPPSVYRRGGAGITIRFAIVESPNPALGRLLVAATPRGICAVAMAASDGDLMRLLAREYPAATVVADAGALATWTRAILAHLAGRQPRLDLPLDIQATAFQWQVWQALAAIPYGETRTYGEIAAAIGRPQAVRAVARACASNPVALAIPCHRVVPAAGGEGGYRWGAERKKALLNGERAERAEGREGIR